MCSLFSPASAGASHWEAAPAAEACSLHGPGRCLGRRAVRGSSIYTLSGRGVPAWFQVQEPTVDSRPAASGKPSSHWPPPDGDRDTTRDSLGTQRLGEKLFQGPKTTRGFSSTNYPFHENCSSVPDSAHCGCWLPPLLVVTPLSSTLHISHMVHRDHKT